MAMPTHHPDADIFLAVLCAILIVTTVMVWH
jgi:hypothetical protein